MKSIANLLLLAAFWQAEHRPTPEPRYFRYERPVNVNSAQDTQVCSILDGEVYAHARPALADLRLFVLHGDDKTEVPYALTMSQTAATGDSARVLNPGLRAGHVVFDLEMPSRAYSDVRLDLEGKNFLATAKVTGLRALTDKDGTQAGTFTLFDLSGQHLGRSTTLKLAESSFPFLRVDLAFTGVGGNKVEAAPAMIKGADVPPSREAQTVYVPVAESTTITQRRRESVATFELPARVPVERVSVEMEPGDHTNFSRVVRLTARAASVPNSEPELVTGDISRVRITEAGQEVRHELLGFPATLGSNAEAPAKIEVAVQNGDDRPLAIHAIRLEMRRRELCFNAPTGPVTLFYGDSELEAPTYDYARIFQARNETQLTALGPETKNSRFIGRDDTRSLTERHPEILWLGLLAVIGVLGVVAFRSAKKI
jgi:hypothetical protein